MDVVNFFLLYTFSYFDATSFCREPTTKKEMITGLLTSCAYNWTPANKIHPIMKDKAHLIIQSEDLTESHYSTTAALPPAGSTFLKGVYMADQFREFQERLNPMSNSPAAHGSPPCLTLTATLRRTPPDKRPVSYSCIPSLVCFLLCINIIVTITSIDSRTTSCHFSSAKNTLL